MLVLPKRIDWKIHVSVPDGIGNADFTPPSLRSHPKINFIISTCNRPTAYIHKMLATMFMSGFPSDYKINLVVSGDDTEYLDCYKHMPNIRIYKWNSEDWDAIKKLPVKFKASYNYLQCLGITEHENSLIFEDDIIFQQNWLNKLFKCITAAENDGHENYMMTLFCLNKYGTTKDYAKVPRITWAGTQAMYYPRKTLEKIRPFVQQITDIVAKIQIEPSDPIHLNAYDMLIKECSILDDIDIFSTCESLVQHIGLQTAGGTGQDIMKSPIFYSNKLDGFRNFSS